ncbi:hypothetical protein ACFE04_025853 [Oxalis oulophora]
MQLYHHPVSMDSQMVRLALEEKGVDYTSHHVNPILGKNLDASFFRKYQTAKLPVFQNGSLVMFDPVEIIQYIEKIAAVTCCAAENMPLSEGEVLDWMEIIHDWERKYFTLSYVPEKYRIVISKFLRRVVIARMAESPDLASAYHHKLKEAYETEERLKTPDNFEKSKGYLIRLLDGVNNKLRNSVYLVGNEFTMADVMLIPVLAHLVLLKLEDEFITSRPNLALYWVMVQQRPSYKKVIGKYFDGWRRYKTLTKTWCVVQARSLLRKY